VVDEIIPPTSLFRPLDIAFDIVLRVEKSVMNTVLVLPFQSSMPKVQNTSSMTLGPSQFAIHAISRHKHEERRI
jgi:hypothetical protein